MQRVLQILSGAPLMMALGKGYAAFRKRAAGWSWFGAYLDRATTARDAVLSRIPMPGRRVLEPFVESERARAMDPALIGAAWIIAIYLGLYPSSLGHLDTTPWIWSFLPIVSGFNPFLGLATGLLFALADWAAKWFALAYEIVGTILPLPFRGMVESVYGGNLADGIQNAVGARIGYLGGYTAMILTGLTPGLMSRFFRFIVFTSLRPVFRRRAAAGAAISLLLAMLMGGALWMVGGAWLVGLGTFVGFATFGAIWSSGNDGDDKHEPGKQTNRDGELSVSEDEAVYRNGQLSATEDAAAPRQDRLDEAEGLVRDQDGNVGRWMTEEEALAAGHLTRAEVERFRAERLAAQLRQRAAELEARGRAQAADEAVYTGENAAGGAAVVGEAARGVGSAVGGETARGVESAAGAVAAAGLLRQAAEARAAADAVLAGKVSADSVAATAAALSGVTRSGAGGSGGGSGGGYGSGGYHGPPGGTPAWTDPDLPMLSALAAMAGVFGGIGALYASQEWAKQVGNYFAFEAFRAHPDISCRNLSYGNYETMQRTTVPVAGAAAGFIPPGAAGVLTPPAPGGTAPPEGEAGPPPDLGPDEWWARSDDAADRLVKAQEVVNGEYWDTGMFERHEEILEQARLNGDISPALLAQMAAERDAANAAKQARFQAHADKVNEEMKRRDAIEDARREREAQLAREREERAGKMYEATQRMVDKYVDDPERADWYRDYLERHKDASPEEIRRINQAIRGQTIEAEGLRAEADATYNDGIVKTLESVRDNSQRINRALSMFVAPTQGLAIVGQAGKIMLVQGATTGVTEGYSRDGVRGAVTSGIGTALDSTPVPTFGFATPVVNAVSDHLAGDGGGGDGGRRVDGRGRTYYDGPQEGDQPDSLMGKIWNNVANHADQNYNPVTIANRLANAQNAGEFIDGVMDIVDFKNDATTIRSKFNGSDTPDTPRRDADVDAPKRPADGDAPDARPKPDYDPDHPPKKLRPDDPEAKWKKDTESLNEVLDDPGRSGKFEPADQPPPVDGMPTRNVRQMQMVADKHMVQIHVRSTNPDAKALLDSGAAIPKPEGLKMKTINPHDVQLGAPADGVGKVGYFEPQKPPPGSDPELVKRYNQRMQEYQDQSKTVKSLVDSGQVRVDPNGVIIDVETGKPFTGDHDLFHITNFDGSPVSADVYNRVQRDLMKPPAGVQHGTHKSWDYSDLSRQRPDGSFAGEPLAEGAAQSPWEIAKGVDEKILKSHGSGAKEPDPLITFTASEARIQKPTATWFEFGQDAGAQP